MLVAFSVAPSGRPPSGGPATDPHDPDGDPALDDASVHDAVAAAVAIVRASGLPHHTDAMFTTIEGEWDECLAVVKACCEAMERFGSRTSLVLKADLRPGYTGELQGKVDRLEQALRERG